LFLARLQHALFLGPRNFELVYSEVHFPGNLVRDANYRLSVRALESTVRQTVDGGLYYAFVEADGRRVVRLRHVSPILRQRDFDRERLQRSSDSKLLPRSQYRMCHVREYRVGDPSNAFVFVERERWRCAGVYFVFFLASDVELRSFLFGSKCVPEGPALLDDRPIDGVPLQQRRQRRVIADRNVNSLPLSREFAHRYVYVGNRSRARKLHTDRLFARVSILFYDRLRDDVRHQNRSVFRRYR
jgi:hypothetical protein